MSTTLPIPRRRPLVGLVCIALMTGACADPPQPSLRSPIGDPARQISDAQPLDRDIPASDSGAKQRADQGLPDRAVPPEDRPPEDLPEFVPDARPGDGGPDAGPPEPPAEPPEEPPEEPEGPPPAEPGELDPEPGLTAGWIGGPCADDADCDYAEAVCLHEDEGYPRGHCSLGCERFCPDRDGMPVTFCVDDVFADTGACAQRCDFDLFGATGCRPGYRCELQERFNAPELARGVCLPGAAEITPIDACFAELEGRAMSYDRREPRLDHPADHPELECLVDGPLWLDSPVEGVSFRYVTHDASRPVFASCHLANGLARLAAVLREYDIVEVGHIGTYNCRTIAGTDRLSQHSHGLAIDIRWFVTSDGTMYDVVEHWEHGLIDFETGEMGPFRTEAGRILAEIGWRMHSQRIFNTVLTPDYNAGHDNHFHVDLYPGRQFIGADGGWSGHIGPNTHGD